MNEMRRTKNIQSRFTKSNQTVVFIFCKLNNKLNILIPLEAVKSVDCNRNYAGRE